MSAGARTSVGPGRRMATAFAVLGLLMSVVATAGSVSPAAASLPPTPGTGLPPGQMPLTGQPGAPRAAAVPAGAHLTYYGGHVMPHVQVTQVLYGSGTYASEVSGTGALTISSFYTGVTNSAHFDWLTEYNTNRTAANGQPGTNEIIGRGSFAGQRTIAPAASRNGSTISDASIKTELKAQITAGVLPMPNANTLFAVYFPANKTISSGSGTSGVDFCAYHGTVAAAGSIPEFYYSVLPDFTTGGMASGCGNGTRYQNETSVSSHEMIEAVTDPQVGIAGSIGPPLAWYDQTNGEIGDICNHQHATITGGDGATYTVQNEFSNVYNACIAVAPTATNDFSIAANPGTVTVNAGSSGTSSISTAVTSGAAQAVSLSASGLPSGASAAFSPSSVTAGGSSTLTLSTTGSTAAGTYPITVTGAGASATHTTTVSLTVNGTAPPGGGVANGGFELGNLSSWTPTGTEAVTTSTPRTGSYADQGGASSPTNGDSSIVQTFTVPTGATQLSFWYQMTCPDTVTYDWATATLKDNTANTTSTVLPKRCATSSTYTQVTAPVTAGHSYTLTMTSHDDNYAGDASFTKFDDVTLNAPTAPSDFSIAANPGTVTVTGGSSGTSSIATAVTTGAAQTVNLSATGLPSGATASFSPSSVTAGGSSTLTLGTAASTPAGTYPITITGTGTSATHTTSVSLTVNAPPPPVNDFSIALNPTSATVPVGAAVATTVSTAVTSGVAQSVSLSATGLPSGTTAGFSPGSVTAGGSSTLTFSTGASTPAGTYTVTVTGTGSQTHSKTFTLTVTAPVTGGVTNGGFETGSFSGWTTSGTESVTTATPHSGTYADQSGASTPTNGDSSITQTFTVPTGAGTLSFWYKMTCPDTVTYDWATATLKDNTTNVTTTVLPKTCATNTAWVRVTASVVAGHSYTLKLISHDDNFSGDASFTKFDDVTLS
jgi:hypothetical protein